MSDEASAEGYVMGWRSSSPYYRVGAIIPALNKSPKVRERFLKTMKYQTASDLMEGIVKNGN